jgi:hypothetical protein
MSATVADVRVSQPPRFEVRYVAGRRGFPNERGVRPIMNDRQWQQHEALKKARAKRRYYRRKAVKKLVAKIRIK